MTGAERMGRGAPHPLLFLIVVLVASAPFWLLNLVGDAVALPFGLPPSVAMIIVPFATALVLVARERGRAGVGAWLSRIWDALHLRRWGWLALALLVPVGVELAARGLGLALGTVPSGPMPLGLLGVIGVFAVYCAGAVLEELGWAGYATPPLQERYGIFGAGLLIGVVWGLWHVVPWLMMGRDAGWVVAQAAVSVGLRIVIGYVAAGSGGSVSAAILVHAASNTMLEVLPGGAAAYSPLATAAFTWVAVAVLAVLRRPRVCG